MTTAFLDDHVRCERVYRALVERYAAGYCITVVLGAEAVELVPITGANPAGARPVPVAMAREASRYIEALLERDGIDPAVLLVHPMPYTWRATRNDAPTLEVRVRTASLEESAALHARHLRQPAGWRLTRATANRIAEMLEALSERTQQPVREHAR